MRRIALAGLALLLVAADTPAQVVEDTWEVAHLEGVKVGSLHTTVRSEDTASGKILRTSAAFELR